MRKLIIHLSTATYWLQLFVCLFVCLFLVQGQDLMTFVLSKWHVIWSCHCGLSFLDNLSLRFHECIIPDMSESLKDTHCRHLCTQLIITLFPLLQFQVCDWCCICTNWGSCILTSAILASYGSLQQSLFATKIIFL